MRKLLTSALIIGSALIFCNCSSFSTASDKGKSDMSVQNQKRLNNLVSEIAVTEKSPGVFSFMNPKTGWVFLAAKTDSAKMDGDKIIRFEKGESMQWLPAGQHEISFNCKTELTVRSIPEIIYSRCTAHYNSPDKQPFIKSSKEEHGREGMNLYYWDYLKKNILPNYNVIVGWMGPDCPIEKDWCNYGRKVIIGGSVSNDETETTKIFAKWSKGFEAPYSGIIADEFVPPSKIISEKDETLGGYKPGLGFKKKILDLINQLHDKYKNNVSFYAYLGVPSDTPLKNCGPLMERLLKNNYYWVWEAYMWPDKSNPQDYLNKNLVGRMKNFRTLFPGSEKNCVVCLAPIISWDKESVIDFKVWLDMQMNLIANNNAFDSIFGVTLWTSTYTDPEIQRWFSMLMRHYCIDGNTGMLSDKYGYTLKLNYISNSDFSDGLKMWDVDPAESGSIFVKKTKDFTFNKGYFPYSADLLVMKKTAKNNQIGQKIKNLKPGQLYSISYLCGNPEITAGIKYNQQINISGAQVIQKAVDRRGDIRNNICWNYVRVIFRAEDESAYFSISDGNENLSSGYPEMKEMIFDSIKVQPFYND
ncbi:MAG: hypothetical protein A2017_02605 [Lentisphaerae bacterium GWF2_44_16]|nr:MAG: hypothetical protein A2017_02605 [Lentisphaerae bacterium GWF2_44_16]